MLSASMSSASSSCTAAFARTREGSNSAVSTSSISPCQHGGRNKLRLVKSRSVEWTPLRLQQALSGARKCARVQLTTCIANTMQPPLHFKDRHSEENEIPSRVPEFLGESTLGTAFTNPSQHIEVTGRRAPYRVLVTGSTKGIGRALVEGFLQAGDSVCITSRSKNAVDSVVAKLQASYGREGVVICGIACDVRKPDDVASLTSFAQEQMKGVDIWINNAGSNGYAYQDLVETSPEVIKEIIDTNVYGTLICCREAIVLMSTQPNGGHVFNMEGAGSDGNPTRQYASYGFSKAGMLQLSKSLTDETSTRTEENGCAAQEGVQSRGCEYVGVHTLSPGLVYTELLKAGQYTFGRNGRFFINSIAESPANVAINLVPKIRAFAMVPENAKRAGSIKYLTPERAFFKLYNRLVKGENKDRFFLEDDPTDQTVPKIRLEWAPGFEPAAEKLAKAVREIQSDISDLMGR